MIKPGYAFTLAQTKLHSKRGVLITSVIVAGLLFAALIAAVVVFTGIEKSAVRYVEKAGNDQYLVKVSPVIPYQDISVGGELSIQEIREIKQFEQDYYNKQREKYSTLGLRYDQTTEIPSLQPSSWLPDSIPEEQRVMVNWESPVITALEAQKFSDYAKRATNTFEDLKIIGNNYNASGYYAQKSSKLPSIPHTRLILNDKEDFGSEMKSGDASSYGYFINSAFNSQYSFEDEQLLERFLIPQSGTLQGIPVIISAQEAASLFGKEFGIEGEPKETNAKNQWLKTIQENLNGHTYQACHRNSIELTMLSKIQRDFAEIKNNEGNTEYIKPNLLYNYPSTPCGDITIREDTRTLLEKNTTSQLEETQKKLDTYIEPSHQLLTFQIVGVINAQPHISSITNIEDYLKSLLSPQDVSMTAVIPLQSYQSLPDNLKFKEVKDATDVFRTFESETADQFDPRILEFSNINDARAFLSAETCPSTEINCNKKFNGDPYGSNYLILDDIGSTFKSVASIAFPVVLILAAIIIWFTISRIMSENRKETAIYRAMGAKRVDITIIYGVYVLLVALQIALISLGLGVGAAYIIDAVYGRELTNIASSAFGIIDAAPQFRLFDLSSPLLWVTIGSIFIISIIASVQPMVRNVLRSPIRDIRDE